MYVAFCIVSHSILVSKFCNVCKFYTFTNNISNIITIFPFTFSDIMHLKKVFLNRLSGKLQTCAACAMSSISYSS